MKQEKIEQEFFDKLAEKLEKIFPKNEKCQCGKRLSYRSKAILFNTYANIIFREIVKKHKIPELTEEEIKKEMKPINDYN